MDVAQRVEFLLAHRGVLKLRMQRDDGLTKA